MRQRIIYIASALTTASPAFKYSVIYFKKLLHENTSDIILRWVGQESPVEKGFYSRDLGNVQMCDVFIAILDQPSIGVGIELSQAIIERKAILCLYQESHRISRLVQAAALDGHINLISYRDIHDAVDVATDFVRKTSSSVEA